MSDAAIAVRLDEVGKRFDRVHERPMLLREAFLNLTGRSMKVEDLWALSDVSFEVARGTTFGVLGRNGSGKSTLLQLIAGTSYPTKGTVSTQGRIASFLALGAGFHPDMTGEENITVNAGLIGIPPDQARNLKPKIIEFSELGDAIDTPIRYYSSGMRARLGFSVAINMSPDILAVDEVLAVGDMAFQKKCMKEIERMRASGVTIVYATQSPMAIQHWCTEAIWLDQGQVQLTGPADEVAGAYQADMEARA